MKAVESEGATVESAIERALVLMGLAEDAVEVDVLQDAGDEEGTPARVRVRPKEDGAAEAADAAPEAEPADDPESGDEAEAAREAESADEDEAAREAEPADDPEPIAEPEPAPEPESKVDTATGPEPKVSRETPRRKAGGAGADEDVPARDDDDRANRALDFLDDLIELLGVNCEAEELEPDEPNKIHIELVGPDTGLLIGRRGQTLDAIEFLLNRSLDRVALDGGRVALDAEGYRDRRAAKLVDLAKSQATRVRESRRSVSLEPMSPRDRRTVHMALQDDADVGTRSEGEGQDRFVIIEPQRG